MKEKMKDMQESNKVITCGLKSVHRVKNRNKTNKMPYTADESWEKEKIEMIESIEIGRKRINEAMKMKNL